MKIMLFSGAGLSAESGIRTFRDTGGLWEEYKIEEVCQAGCLQTNKEMTIKFYDARRFDLKDKKPNEAHKIMARLKQKYPKNIKVVTQNVDNLLESAGCDDVMHLHGFLTELRCQRCNKIIDIAYQKQYDAHQHCPQCKEDALRPNIIFFGESAPMYTPFYKLLDEIDMFVAVGTSGAVINIAAIASLRDNTWLVNLDKDEFVDSYFEHVFHEKATSGMKHIEEEIERLLAPKE